MSDGTPPNPFRIVELTRVEFDAREPLRTGLLDSITDEAEFYQTGDQNLIGVLIKDQTDNDWNGVVLGRDEAGVFRAIDVDVSINDVDDARERLVTTMERHAASGRAVFPQ